MLKEIPGMRVLEIPMSGGLDENSTADELGLGDCLEMENWRLSKNGKRKEKRSGLYAEYTGWTEDVYGFTAYYDSDGAYCQLAILESKIERKVGAGAYTSIHAFSSNITHPVRPIEVQGKVFIINEVDSRFIHTDKADYQIGIDAPTTIPTLTATAGGAFTAGTYRYAITYARSGNFGNESNPIKFKMGTVAFTGSGLNDMTVSGTYTGSTNMSVRVEIDGTGTPDTIKYSYDGGTTWHATTIKVDTTMYLNYGITLTFGAVTGHTSTDRWDFTASAIAVTVAANQYVALTAIPVSSDAQVNQRKIYRTTLNGSRFYLLGILNDNTDTTFNDNIADSALGAKMEEDNDVMPNGKFSVWWDDRMWVSGDNIIYYSDIGNPEAFDTSARYVTVRKGDQNDEITQMVDFKDNIYVFKKNAIFIIQKQPAGGYGIYLCNRDFGCIAPWSMVEVNNVLMFFSYRGIEVYNGCDSYQLDFSLPVSRSMSYIDNTKLDYICACHVRPRSEVWFSIPDPTTGSAFTLVYHYIANKFYKFSFHKTPSCVVDCKDANRNLATKMGTRDGYLLLCETKGGDGTTYYQDDSTNISSNFRTGWIDADVYGDVRKVDVEYELETGMTLYFNAYVNFDKDVFRASALAGSTPTSTDIELRRPINANIELGLRGRYFCIEFVNNEALTKDLKVNSVRVFYKPRHMKRTIEGD